MSKNKWLGRTLITLLVIVVLAAAGYAVYRYGYARGVMAAGQGEMPFVFSDMPGMQHDFLRIKIDQGGMQMPHGISGKGRVGMNGPGNFEFDHPFMQYNMHGGNLGQRFLFSPFSMLFRVLFYGIVLWLIYKVVMLLLGGKGWKLSFKRYEDETLEEEVAPEKRTRKKS